MDFDPMAALAATQETMTERYARVVTEAEIQRESAMRRAREYAEHLAGGGDPRVFPELPYEDTKLVSQRLALVLVYRAWNEARGSTNPVVPVPTHSISGWQVAEFLHAHIGEPVTFAKLSTEHQVRYEGERGERYSKKGTPDEIAKAVIAAQTGTLIARKMKLDGRVAYVLREKRTPDEKPVTNSWNFDEETAQVVA